MDPEEFDATAIIERMVDEEEEDWGMTCLSDLIDSDKFTPEQSIELMDALASWANGWKQTISADMEKAKG